MGFGFGIARVNGAPFSCIYRAFDSSMETVSFSIDLTVGNIG